MGKPRLTNKRRERGAQLGNRNAWKHGQRSAQAELDRKLSVARVRALVLLADALGMFDKKPRTLPLRDRERRLIFRHDPELSELLWLLPSYLENFVSSTMFLKRRTPQS